MRLGTTLFFALATLLTTSSVWAKDVIFRHDKNGWEKGFQALAEGIKAASGITVVLQLQSPAEQHQAFIQTSVAGNSPPEIFTWWNGKQLELLAETGKIANLSAAWDKALAAGFFSEEEKNLVSVNGVPYAIPLNVARYPVLYRKDAFQKAGIEQPPRTWEELIAVLEALKAAGYIPFNVAHLSSWETFIWFSEFMIRANPDAFEGLSRGTVRYNGPEVQAAFDLWVSFFEKGYFGDPREEEAVRQFFNGRAALWLTPEWYVGNLRDKGLKPGEDFGAFIMPKANADAPDSIIVETSVIVVSAEALKKHPALAAGIDYLLSPAAGNALANAPNTGVFNGNLKTDPPNPIVAEVNSLIAARKLRLIMRWWEAVPPDLQGDLLAQMGAFLLNPTAANAAKVMNNMESFNAEYWKQNR